MKKKIISLLLVVSMALVLVTNVTKVSTEQENLTTEFKIHTDNPNPTHV